MSLGRRAAKRDLSERDVVDLLRKSGWTVLQVSVTNGPDLFASKAGRVAAIECKTGTRKLRPGQEQFRACWQGEYVVLRGIEDAQAFNAGENL